MPTLKYLTLPVMLCLLVFTASQVCAQQTHRELSGVVITSRTEPVRGANVSALTSAGEINAVTDDEGAFHLSIPHEQIILRVSGKNIVTTEQTVAVDAPGFRLRIEIAYIIPPVYDGLIISAAQLDPAIERRNDAVWRDTLFSRDDQIFHTLDAGINAGQHEGGGKSVEIRRFGYNLDHGGVGGGLKVLVDNVQQNQGTQGHGQGYLGQLKSLTPELVQDVDILNGPFSAEYGDFSGLGVVHIRQKETLPDQLTARLQGGSYGSLRSFLAWSPELRNGVAILAYEGARTDGPFQNPLGYKRDNLSGNYIRNLDQQRTIGFRFNAGRNDFTSSGQLPLDEVAAGRLDRFGFLDPDNGGRVRSGLLSAYFRRESDTGAVLKLDGFVSRSLFDLWSNFTFFLNDETAGDEIQQHDSRLQQGFNTQYIRPHTMFGARALLIAGANFHANQINVGLFNSAGRAPVQPVTHANARVTNAAGYIQQGLDLLHGHVNLNVGLRYDVFRFRVNDNIDAAQSGAQTATRFQPKFNLAVTPTDQLPLTIHFNYGRGISSQDARGVTQRPTGVRLATTDFYQLGTAHHFRRVSLSADLFLIDRSHEQVYIPDDGSFEFRGPSRAYGFEIKSSMKLTRLLSFNGGLTNVGNVFYRGTRPRAYVDSAARLTANAALTLGAWKGFSGSLRYRHIGNYRLDGEDPAIRASGYDVLDLSVNRQLRRGLDFNLSIDNLTDKRYYETQNFFASRLRPGAPVISRIHATPGYPITITAGLTFRLRPKN
ncbi:MAG: TonB-dependent receptor [Blastocatellia bacterium]